MREIKFRFWEDGEQRDQNELAVYDGGVYCHNTGSVYRDNEIIAEQFTGLKDKNGVEIYENDILITKDDRFLAKVIFDRASLCWAAQLYLRGELKEIMSLKRYILQREKAMNADCLVAGNIHQHKHLLED